MICNSLRRIGTIEVRNRPGLRQRRVVLHRVGGEVPGLLGPDGRRYQHDIGTWRMPADPASDVGRIPPSAFVESAVLIAARGRFALGLGMTQQHQTAHEYRLDSCSARLEHDPERRNRLFEKIMLKQ